MDNREDLIDPMSLGNMALLYTVPLPRLQEESFQWVIEKDLPKLTHVWHIYTCPKCGHSIELISSKAEVICKCRTKMVIQSDKSGQ